MGLVEVLEVAQNNGIASRLQRPKEAALAAMATSTQLLETQLLETREETGRWFGRLAAV